MLLGVDTKITDIKIISLKLGEIFLRSFWRNWGGNWVIAGSTWVIVRSFWVITGFSWVPLGPVGAYWVRPI